GDLNINGPGPTDLSVDGNAASPVFHIAPSSTATISGLRIANENSNQIKYVFGIYNEHATLVVSNCHCIGSGIYNFGEIGFLGFTASANLRIENSILTSNSYWAIYSVGGARSLAQFGTATVQIVSST